MLELSIERRLILRKRIQDKYGDNKIPIILVEESKEWNNWSKVNEYKFLSGMDCKTSFMLDKFRQHMFLLKTEGTVFMCGNKVINHNDDLCDLYNKYQNEDGFLYVFAVKETAFGSNL